MKVGFIGLGSMGAPMARNIIKAGHELTVFNRTRSRAEPLGEAGARIANDPSEGARGVDLLVTMVSDDLANVVKVAGNFLLASAIEAMGKPSPWSGSMASIQPASWIPSTDTSFVLPYIRRTGA